MRCPKAGRLLFSSSFSFSLLCALTLATLSTAQQPQPHNTTTNSTTPSIQYEGNVGDFPICSVTPGGRFTGDQPESGCVSVPSGCAQRAALGLGLGLGLPGTTNDVAAASFSFNGTAIYITSLLNDISPLYTVTLDGKPTDVHGARTRARPSASAPVPAPYTCGSLFAQTGLDPTVEHTLRLSVKGLSPGRGRSRNTTTTTTTTVPGSGSGADPVFALVSYTVTGAGAEGDDGDGEGEGEGNTTRTSGAGGGSGLPANATTSASTSTSTSTSASAAQFSGWGALVFILTIPWAVLVW